MRVRRRPIRARRPDGREESVVEAVAEDSDAVESAWFARTTLWSTGGAASVMLVRGFLREERAGGGGSAG